MRPRNHHNESAFATQLQRIEPRCARNAPALATLDPDSSRRTPIPSFLHQTAHEYRLPHPERYPPESNLKSRPTRATLTAKNPAPQLRKIPHPSIRAPRPRRRSPPPFETHHPTRHRPPPPSLHKLHHARLTNRSNPNNLLTQRGVNSVVECQLPKLNVAGSNPVPRSSNARSWLAAFVGAAGGCGRFGGGGLC